jgi:pimeloyl-ACP methyl ester carboxylesterase
VQNLGASTKFLWPIPDRGLHKRLPLIQAATLVVMGERDGLIPPVYGEAFARAIPDARMEVLPDAGHLPMVEQADAFFGLVERFLAD